LKIVKYLGQIFNFELEKGKYLNLNHYFSPHQSILTVTGGKWGVEGSQPFTEPNYDWTTETLEYADFRFGHFKKVHGGQTKEMNVMLPGIGTFL